jgi:DNA polymerase-4
MTRLDYDTDPAVNRPWEGRAILHLDLDSFFASVAQLDDPALRGLPVIVGSPTKRGVVSTASYEARTFGVRSAMSSTRALKLCPQAVWVPGDFKRYREISGAVFAILESVSSYVLPVSIDEAFCDITPDSSHPRDPVELVEEIQLRVAELGVTCSIGLSTNMTVAKIGSDYEKPRGLTIVRSGQEEAFLAPLAIRALSGIGPKAAERLDEIGIHTLGDIAGLSDDDALLLMGSGGITQRDRARGIDAREVRDTDPVKSVSHENTFSTDLLKKDEVLRNLRWLAEKTATRLRKKGLAGKTISIKMRLADFETHTAAKTVASPVDDVAQLMPVVEELIMQVWREGRPIRLLGVSVSNFGDGDEQLSLLDDDQAIEDLTERKHLSRNIDAIREKYGSDSIRRGLL